MNKNKAEIESKLKILFTFLRRATNEAEGSLVKAGQTRI